MWFLVSGFYTVAKKNSEAEVVLQAEVIRT